MLSRPTVPPSLESSSPNREMLPFAIARVGTWSVDSQSAQEPMPVIENPFRLSPRL
jgi:hypothetical protein